VASCHPPALHQRAPGQSGRWGPGRRAGGAAGWRDGAARGGAVPVGWSPPVFSFEPCEYRVSRFPLLSEEAGLRDHQDHLPFNKWGN
jgi:hypothetical protein